MSGPVEVSWDREAMAGWLNRLDFVRWDRFVDAPAGPDHRMVSVYGWIGRPDGRSDFVQVDFASWAEQPGFSTSSAEYSALIVELFFGPGMPHIECQRVDEYFGGLVARTTSL